MQNGLFSLLWSQLHLPFQKPQSQLLLFSRGILPKVPTQSWLREKHYWFPPPPFVQQLPEPRWPNSLEINWQKFLEVESKDASQYRTLMMSYVLMKYAYRRKHILYDALKLYFYFAERAPFVEGIQREDNHRHKFEPILYTGGWIVETLRQDSQRRHTSCHIVLSNNPKHLRELRLNVCQNSLSVFSSCCSCITICSHQNVIKLLSYIKIAASNTTESTLEPNASSHINTKWIPNLLSLKRSSITEVLILEFRTSILA